MNNKISTTTRYHQKMEQIIDYIYHHLDEPLSFCTLADMACLSEYHWHRIYVCITGETVTKTIRRLRLNRAANDLIKTDLPLIKIAKKAGYSNSDSFTRKFSEDFGMAPVAYRTKGKLLTKEAQRINSTNNCLYEVELKTVTPLTVATLDHQGDYLKIGTAFEKLITFAAVNDLFDDSSQMLGIYYDDPNIVELNKLRSKAGITVQKPLTNKAGIKTITVPMGRFATITHKGPYNELEHAYTWLYNWLINSEYTPGDHPVIEKYINSPREVAPRELLTDIYLSIQ